MPVLIRPMVWICLALLAFLFLPSKALHYGLFESTPEEWREAIGWHSVNISWLWFGSLLIFPLLNRLQAVKLRHKLTLVWVGLIVVSLIMSAKITQSSFGYAVIFLAAALFIISIQAFAGLNVMKGDRFIIGAILLIILVIGGFILYPTLTVLTTMLEAGNPFAILSQSYILNVIWNSVSVSATVGVLATFFGFLFALYTTRIASKRTQFLGKLFSILPIVTPPFVVSLGVTLMLGRSGYLTSLLVEYFGISKNWFYGFFGIAMSHTLALTPMAFMLMEGALKSANATLEEASYSLRASRYQTFFYIGLPLMKPAFANAFLIVTLQSLADFSTPLVLGGNFDVLASQIYFYLVGTNIDYTAASTLGTLLLSFSLLFFWLQHRWIGKRSYVTVSGKANHSHPQGLPSGLKWGIICIFALWCLFTAVLYGSIFYGSFTVNWGVNHSLTFDNYRQLFGQGIEQGAFPSLIQTVLYALVAAPITAILGLLIAYINVRRNFWGKRPLEFITLLCFAVPGTVAGLSYILAFNHSPIYLTGTSAIIKIGRAHV